MSDSTNTNPQTVRVEVAAAPKAEKKAEVIQAMSRSDFEAQLSKAEERGIERGMRRALKQLGVKKEDRDAVLSKAGEFAVGPKPKEGEPDYKSEYEKLKAAAPEVESLRVKAERYAELVKKQADDEFSKLPEPLQKDLVRRKLEDPEVRLAEIIAMRESGLISAYAGPQTPADTKKPATTAGPPGPKPPTPEGTKTPYQIYSELKSQGNRMLAANYAARNSHAIEASRPK